jgi:hypothetical protein
LTLKHQHNGVALIDFLILHNSQARALKCLGYMNYMGSEHNNLHKFNTTTGHSFSTIFFSSNQESDSSTEKSFDLKNGRFLQLQLGQEQGKLMQILLASGYGSPNDA